MLRRRLKRSQEARTELWTFPIHGGMCDSSECGVGDVPDQLTLLKDGTT